MDDVGIPEFPVKAADLDHNEVPDGSVIYQSSTDHVHYLNQTASIVLELCTGANSRADIARVIGEAYGLGADPVAEIDGCLATFVSEGLVS